MRRKKAFYKKREEKFSSLYVLIRIENEFLKPVQARWEYSSGFRGRNVVSLATETCLPLTPGAGVGKTLPV
jgi:hypothetical protein